MPEDLAPDQLMPTVGRWRLALAVRAAAELGIADALSGGPATAADIAVRLSVDAPSLRRLLRTLASEGVFREHHDGRFELNGAARMLLSTAGPGEMIKGWSILPSAYRAWIELPSAIRKGEVAFKLANGAGFHEFLQSHADEAALYNAAVETTIESFDEATDAYDWGAFKTIVDVGGGTGGQLLSILHKFPASRGVLFDLPEVVAEIPPDRFPNDMRNRLDIVAGDFFTDPMPAGDAYLLETVVRMFADETAAALLTNIARAMDPSGHVFILDFVQPPGPAESPFGLADLQNMVVYGGVDRSEAEFSALCSAAGLRLVDKIDLGGPHFLLDAVGSR